MRKIDVAILILVAAAGSYTWRLQTAIVPSGQQSRTAEPTRGAPVPAQFAGLELGDSLEKVQATMGEPVTKYGNPSSSGNWIYESSAGKLDCYWVGGRLYGIQCSVVLDKIREIKPNWSLTKGLAMGCDTQQVRQQFGAPSRVRHGDTVQTWNYTSPGAADRELALGFEKDHLLHVRLSLKQLAKKFQAREPISAGANCMGTTCQVVYRFAQFGCCF